MQQSRINSWMLMLGWFGILLMPWYAIEGGFFALEWMRAGEYTSGQYAPYIIQVFLHDRWYLLPPVLLLVLATFLLLPGTKLGATPKQIIALSVAGLASILLPGFVVDHEGYTLGTKVFDRQSGLGVGALLISAAFLFLLTTAISNLGKGRGDAFITGSIGLIIALVAIFVFFPIFITLLRAFKDLDGELSMPFFFRRIFSEEVWALGCLTGGRSCGPAWNSLALAVSTAAATTLLGLSFALVATRTGFKAKSFLRIVTIIPIITPPFVIGLALILLFGRAGIVSEFLHDFFDVEKSRWLYGFFGVWLAQVLSFTPIAFLVLIGVVEGVSPAMEEASSTLRANHWKTFSKVSLPLMKPGLANAFLLGFIESIADFGNPLLLGGGFNVLSTEIYFSIVGAQEDQNKAGILAFVLLFLTLSAFIAQRIWLGKKSFTTVTGKADSGLHSKLNPLLRNVCFATALPWATFTIIVYAMVVFGSFVRLWGYDHSFTLDHYISAFAVEWGADGLWWKGAAWDSYWTTLRISAIAAPLTATVGLLTAYLLVRQKFIGKNAFEFGTMLSFAVPGTVIGVSYILAFNVPPIELTGTGLILIITFVFRNMPVGVRGGIAAMSQLDKNLDEASITLGANSFTTIRKVILPLISPAIIAALAYSFVRAITSVSAVIFLVSADHNMATAYIIGLVENGNYGIAIAYCGVLILTMLAAILLLQFVIGKRILRKDRSGEPLTPNK